MNIINDNKHNNALYQISIGYKTALKTLQIDGTESINSLNYNDYQYYVLDIIDIDKGIYINIESLTDNKPSPFGFILRTNRDP